MISKKSLDIPPFLVMDVMERAFEMEKNGRSIIHLEVGEPDFDTPACIKKACIKAIQEGKTRYTHSLGLKELREAISNHYIEKYHKDVPFHRIIITMGSSPAMFLLFSALLESKDEIILTNPYYACYPNIIRFLGGKVRFVYVNEEDGFQYRSHQVSKRLSNKTKAILINSPANPTGTIVPANVMQELADMGYIIISDEIYHGLVYESEEHSILEFTDNAFVLGGFSKQYAMTGWRLGYLIVPEKFIRPIQKVHQNFFISANSFVQWAGIAALKEAQTDVKHMRETYNDRRKYMLKRLKQIGFKIKFEPQGAFYVLANAQKFSRDSRNLAFDILEKAGVAVTPGIDFGDNAEGFIRLSYANSTKNIREGLNRLEEYIGTL